METSVDGERTLVVINHCPAGQSSGPPSCYSARRAERKLLHRIFQRIGLASSCTGPRRSTTHPSRHSLRSSDMLTCLKVYMSSTTLLDELGNARALSEGTGQVHRGSTHIYIIPDRVMIYEQLQLTATTEPSGRSESTGTISWKTYSWTQIVACSLLTSALRIISRVVV